MFSSRARVLREIATGKPPARTGARMRRAVVLGGSLAGLLAARVLSDHADEVLLIERDELTGPDPRPGVPQGSQIHALLKGGEIQLSRWFPGFVDEAVGLGMIMPADDSRIHAHLFGQDLRLAAIPTLMATRPYLESLVRKRTLDVGNIRLVTGRATGVAMGGDRVVGARYVPAGTDQERCERADFVVDAMGRSSRLTDWLAADGWPRPELIRMPIELNYVSCLFERDERITDAQMVVAQREVDGVPRGLMMMAVEGGRWIMMAAGYGEVRPGRSVPELAEFGRSGGFPPVLAEIADNAQPVGEVIAYRQADSRRREFHALGRFPAGLVATGDAVASFNPIYGQGMTSALLHASCLSAYLRGGPLLDQPARRYFDLVRVVVDAAWRTSTFADLGLPHVDGPYPRGYRFSKRLGDLVFQASLTDQRIHEQISQVRSLLAHPDTLSSPGVLARVLWRSLCPASG